MKFHVMFLKQELSRGIHTHKTLFWRINHLEIEDIKKDNQINK